MCLALQHWCLYSFHNAACFSELKWAPRTASSHRPERKAPAGGLEPKCHRSPLQQGKWIRDEWVHHQRQPPFASRSSELHQRNAASPPLIRAQLVSRTPQHHQDGRSRYQRKEINGAIVFRETVTPLLKLSDKDHTRFRATGRVDLATLYHLNGISNF